MRLFVEYTKSGYMDAFNNVSRVSIKKQEKKNKLFIYDYADKYIDIIPLNEIKLAFMVDTSGKDCKEYFRYEK